MDAVFWLHLHMVEGAGELSGSLLTKGITPVRKVHHLKASPPTIILGLGFQHMNWGWGNTDIQSTVTLAHFVSKGKLLQENIQMKMYINHRGQLDGFSKSEYT